MTDVVTRLVVRGDGSLAVLDQFENKMEAAGKATDRATGAVANYEARMAKARAAMEAGNAISTQTVARRSAEQRAFDGLASSVDKSYALRIRLEREAERAAVSAANAVNLGYISQEQALTTLVALEARHAAQLGQVAAASDDAAAATMRLSAANQAGARSVEMGRMRNQQLMYQMVDMGQAIPLLLQSPLYGLQNMGFQVAQIGQMYYGQGGMGAALKDMGSMLAGAVSRVGPFAVGIAVAAAAVAGLTYEINKTAEVQVGFFDVALAGWQLFAEGVAGAVAPLFSTIASWLQQGWDAAAPILKNIGNTIIGTFAGAFEAIKAIWSGLPPALGDILISTANNVILAVQNMINGVGTMINGFLAPYNAGLEAMGQATIPTVGQVSLPGMENPYQGAFNGLGADVSGAVASAQQDYLGGAFGAISQRAQDIAAARKEVEGLGGAAQAANDNVKKLADDGLTSVAEKSFNVVDAMQSAFQGIGSGILDVARNAKSASDFLGGVFDMLMDKVAQLASSWLDNIVNNGINSFLGMLGGGVGGGNWNIPSGFVPGGFFPGFASGTNSAPGGLSWVGERGPELVNLPRGAQVFNHQQSMGMAANQNRPISFQTNIINNAGVEVVERSGDDGQGGVRQEIVLNRAVANAIGKPGPAQRAVRQTGRLVTR